MRICVAGEWVYFKLVYLYNSRHSRSVHNVRIERLWRDVRKDCLEAFRQIFLNLEDMGLLDMGNPVHRICLYLVFQPRVQASLDRTVAAWNNHRVRTARNRTPNAMWEASRERAIQEGYWYGDPGDDLNEVGDDLHYGVDGEAPLPPADEMRDDPLPPRTADEGSDESEIGAGIRMHGEEELDDARSVLEGFDLDQDDSNWGIDTFCGAVAYMYSKLYSSGS